MKSKILFLCVLITLFGKAQNTITVSFSGPPNERFRFIAYEALGYDNVFKHKDNLNPPFNNAEFDNQGKAKVSAEYPYPLLVLIETAEFGKMDFYKLALLQPNSSYQVKFIENEILITKEVENEIFANEVRALNKMYRKPNSTGEFLFYDHSEKAKQTDSFLMTLNMPNSIDDMLGIKRVNTLEELIEKTTQKCQERNRILDSAFGKNLITKSFYDYMMKENLCTKLDNLLFITNYDGKEKAVNHDKEMQAILDETKSVMLNQSYLPIRTYKYLLSNFIYKESKISNKLNESKWYTNNYNFITSNNYPEWFKNYALFELFSNSGFSFVSNNDSVLAYVDKFKKDCTNKVLVDLITKKYNPNKFEEYAKIISPLRNINNKKTTLQNELKKRQGKYVYVNYTLGLGGEYLEAGIKIQKRYNNNVQVLFLFFNDELNTWKRNVDLYELDENNCFFVEKGNKDEFLQKVSSATLGMLLPINVVFDKSGKIIDPKAPDTKEILKTGYFDKLN